MKNIEKLINKVLLTALVSIGLVACSSKINEREGQLNSDDLDYTNTEDMIDPLIGAYQIFGTRGWEEPLLLSVRGDDVNSGGLGDQQPFWDTDQFIYNKDYWMYNSLFALHYSDIVKLNTAMELINLYRSFADPSYYDEADQYLAEIKVMRAWLHFNLARNWGDVFIINTTEPDTEYINGTVSKDAMMEYVIAQMNEAIPVLLDERPNERTDIYGGITRYAAMALKAMAYQELENYQEVANVTGDIINSDKFMLYSDFYNLFKTDGEVSNENLWEIQFSDFGNATGDTFYHLYAPFGPTAYVPARPDASGGWGFFEPSMKYIKFMLDRGETVRLETSVLFTPDGIAEIQSDPNYATLPSFVSNTTPDGDVINNSARADFFSGKHYMPSNQIVEGRNNYGAGKNYIIVRYAEILLMYAEALTHGASGNGLTADQAVNLVRARAGLGNVSGVTTQTVMDEKLAELAMEWGVRYYDMIRLNWYDELSYDGRTFTADKELLPYPQGQVDALPLNN